MSTRYRVILNDPLQHKVLETDDVKEVVQAWLLLNQLIKERKESSKDTLIQLLLFNFKDAYNKRQVESKSIIKMFKENSNKPELFLHNFDLLIKKIKRNPRQHIRVFEHSPEILGTKEGLVLQYFNNDILARWPDEVKVKLVLIETGLWSYLPKIIQSQLSQYGSYFGFHHAALLIGEYLIDWHNHSIVTVRPIRSKALLCLDIGKLPKNEEIFLELCDVIAEWNRVKTYGRHRDSNCQCFILECLSRLGLIENIKNNSILDSLQKNGTMEVLLFDPHTGKGIKFDNHEAFDKYVRDTYGDTLSAQETSGGVIDLLKSMDRGFWARDSQYKGNCPFGNPLATMSFIGHMD